MFWFRAFDGSRAESNAYALIAEERERDSFYGFWTDDPDLIGRVLAHLRTTYG